MRTEIKTALIMGIVIAGGIASASLYFGTIEQQLGQNDTNLQTQDDLPTIDKTRFKKAPKLEGISGYINTSPKELMQQLDGKVVLYDIWTYSCVNCQRTLPHLTAWSEKYSDKGLIIVGIHSPEFEFEKDIENVKIVVEKFGIKYPVILDNDKKIWDAFENRYWPRKYIADDEGYIRYDHIGEGAYDETETVIQELLRERAARLGLDIAVAQPLVDIEEFKHGSRTPELYFGYDFALGRNQLGNKEGFQPEKSVSYVIPQSLRDNHFYLGGTWRNLADRMVLTSESGTIVLPYFAKQVNIVAAGDAELEILLDGKPLSKQDAGSDVTGDGMVSISGSTLYNLVNSEEAAKHTIQINVDRPGFEIYTFTFG
ncbi:MAG: redoxin domain-containing protein [Candidatus Nitrosotenuis sp.]